MNTSTLSLQSSHPAIDLFADVLPFDAIRRGKDWERWSLLTADAPPFLGPEFFALNRPLAPDAPAFVARAWTASGVAGALPLVLDGTILRALRSDHSPSYDYFGTADGLDAIWDCLKEDSRWSELVLDKVPAQSLLATRLPMLARRDGYPVVIHADSRHRFFSLPGFEAAMNAKFRHNLQRCERKAGEVVLERIAVPTRADFNEAVAIEAKAWKRENGTSIDADPRVAHTYEALVRLLGPRGRAALYFLRANGRRIATLFAVEDAHTLFALKIGFDPAAANLSPGHLMILEAARDAERRGLAELDFGGRDDEWKQKWTDNVHEMVALRIYAKNLRGLACYGLREVIKPMVPEPARSTPRSPLPRHCQQTNIFGAHTLRTRIVGRIENGLGIRSGIRRLLARKPATAADSLGAPSQFPVGSWVRVLDRAELEKTLDEQNKTRGLVFVPVQWEECGRVLRVQRHVRRMRDDAGKFRPVSRTVLLEGSDCGGHGTEPAGCGRHCPLMYRDEWLIAAQPPAHAHETRHVRHARVRAVDEITGGLDMFGRRDGVTFMPEMAAYAGKRLAIAGQLEKVYEYDRWITPRAPLFLLDRAQCDGGLAGAKGPCDRACTLIWHADWLTLEPELEPEPTPNSAAPKSGGSGFDADSNDRDTLT